MNRKKKKQSNELNKIMLSQLTITAYENDCYPEERFSKLTYICNL